MRTSSHHHYSRGVFSPSPIFQQEHFLTRAWAKIFPVPPPTTVPAFCPEPVRPPNWVLSLKISKILPHFSLNFDYFLAQNCIRKLYYMLKTPKFALILQWEGAFLASSDNFSKSPFIRLSCESPPSDSVPNGDQKLSPKASSPPTKNFVEKSCIWMFTWQKHADRACSVVACILAYHTSVPGSIPCGANIAG